MPDPDTINIPDEYVPEALAAKVQAVHSNNLGCVLMLITVIAGILAFFWLISDRNQKQELIKAGYVQTVQDGHVIWVKPDKQEKE